MFDLARIGFVSGHELIDPGIGILEVDIDDRQLLPEPEPGAGRPGHGFLEDLACGLAIAHHARSGDL